MNTFIAELRVNNGTLTDHFTIYQTADGRYEVKAYTGDSNFARVVVYNFDEAVDQMIQWATWSFTQLGY